MFSESVSLRSTSRIANVSLNTVSKMLVDVGAACMEYQDKTSHDLQCKRIQVDEICSFYLAKVKMYRRSIRTNLDGVMSGHG